MEMNLGLSERVAKLRDRVSEIIRNDIMPLEAEYHAEVSKGDRWTLTDRQVEIMTGLKQLASYRDSTLLVTNLRPALIPPPKRAVGKRLQEYQDALAFIRDLAAARTSPSSNLQLLFL